MQRLEFLRKCRICDLEAFTEQDLDLFRKHKEGPYGRENICKKCASVQSLDYQRRNKDHHKASKARYYQKNRDRFITYNLNYWSNHREQRRKYVLNNKEHINLKKRGYNQKLRQKVLKRLGYKCVHCGFNTNWRAFQIDHINSDGAEDRKKYGTGRPYYNHLLRLNKEDLENKYQLLCANCNQIKQYENKEHSRLLLIESVTVSVQG